MADEAMELGKKSDTLHRRIGKKAAISGINKLYLFGTQVKYTLEGAIENGFAKGNIFHGTKEKIARKVLEDIDSDTWILVKGSRGMAMETVIRELQKLLTVNS